MRGGVGVGGSERTLSVLGMRTHVRTRGHTTQQLNRQPRTGVGERSTRRNDEEAECTIRVYEGYTMDMPRDVDDP